MIVYIPIGSGPLRDKIIAAGHGMIVTPERYGVPKYDCEWVFDNGAFGDFKHGRKFQEARFIKYLKRIVVLPEKKLPKWCVCPDKVASKDSLSFSVEWIKRLPQKLDWYLAIQDGMDREAVHLAIIRFGFKGLFIGGSSGWKNAHAWEWVELAREWGIGVHLARVNGWKRLQWSVNLGVDSVDGTGWTRAPTV